MSSVFDKVASLMEAKKKTAATDWTSTVNEIAMGKEPTPARLEDLLTRTAKTLDDLKTAVDAKIKRQSLRAKMECVPSLQRDMAEVDRLYNAECAKLEAAQSRYNEATAPLKDRAFELQLIDKGEQARDALIATCADEELRLELSEAERSLWASQRRRGEIRQAINFGQTGYGDMESAQRQPDRRVAADMKAEAQKKIDAATAAKAELADAEKQGAAIERTISEIRERMLIP